MYKKNMWLLKLQTVWLKHTRYAYLNGNVFPSHGFPAKVPTVVSYNLRNSDTHIISCSSILSSVPGA